MQALVGKGGTDVQCNIVSCGIRVYAKPIEEVVLDICFLDPGEHDIVDGEPGCIGPQAERQAGTVQGHFPFEFKRVGPVIPAYSQFLFQQPVRRITHLFEGNQAGSGV